MYKSNKFNKKGTARPGQRNKKRKFYGNQFSKEHDSDLASTSAEKLRRRNGTEITVDPTHGYRIIHFVSIFSTLTAILKCKECESDVTFNVTDEEGLGFQLAVKCYCRETKINSCPKINNKSFEINRRIVFVMRLLGVGLEGLNIFCGMMDIGQGMAINTYYSCIKNIWNAANAVFDIMTKKAVQEEKTKTAEAGSECISVSGDGTWSKRGFSSLFGVVSLIGKNTNKVLDVIVKSSFCSSCKYWEHKVDTDEYEEWLEKHKEECACTHSGSAGKMEVDGVIEMFKRSVERFGVRYKNYIGDGDTKTFKSLIAENPYGDEFPVKKKECIGHVQKRMGSRLRSAKKKHAGIGGKGEGKLTDQLIRDLSTYYGLAIRRHSDSVTDMQNAIWATFNHKCSTDENPMHENCPPGMDSWCKWKRAEVEQKLDDYHHPPPLSSKVQEVLRPIYKELTSDDLIERCLGGHTQNNNESYNSVLWHFAPKHRFSSVKIIEIAAFLAACLFNEGYTSFLIMMEAMGLKIGPQAKIMADGKDNNRIQHANRCHLESSKEARTARRNKRAGQNEFFQEEEGLLYAPGIAD